MGKVMTFFHISATERRLFLEAVFWCGVARLAIVFIPFRKYYWLLGKPQENGETPEAINQETTLLENQETTSPLLAQIAKAVGRASRNVPWKTRCLVEAITAKRMLVCRKIACTIYLGVAKEHGQMIAHAWLKSGNIILTGKNGKKNYTIVSLFE